MKKSPFIGVALLSAAGITSATIPADARTNARTNPPSPAEAATMPHIASGQVVDLGGGVTAGGTTEVIPINKLPLETRQQLETLHANDTPLEKAAQYGSLDPTCWPWGVERHVEWIRYQFDSESVPAATGGSARIDKVWTDDCYNVLGELRGPGLSALMTADLTLWGALDFKAPTFPADGVYEWHKYKSDVGDHAHDHGMHAFKRTVLFASKSQSDFSHKITMQMDSYAGLTDYFCWLREDVELDGTPNEPRGEGCYYID